MFSFQCAECSQPVRIVEVCSWLYGDPMCSAACAEKAGPKYTTPPALRAELEKTAAHLAQTCALVHRTLPLARSAESSFEVKQVMSSDIGFLAFGALGASVSSEIADSQGDELTTALWDIDRRLHTIVRHMMRLEALGQDTAKHLHTFVSSFGSITTPTPSGAGRTMMQLYEYLVFLHRGVSTLAARAAS